MGIQGLLPFLKASSINCNVKEFKGRSVAVDAYCWLHKGAFSCADKLVKGERTDAYVKYCMKFVNMLLSHNIRVVMVFDGQPLPSKLGTEIERRENRERNKIQAREFLRQGKTAEARKCFQKCVDISSEMALELMRACRAQNVDCIVAPYEADAQLAYLSLQGIVDLVITEDSDLLAFGCARVLFKMDANGQGVLIEREKLSLSFGSRAEFFNMEKFRRMCIMSGCDYLPSLPGIGLGKAFKFFSLTTDSDLNAALCRIPSCLKMPQLEVTQEYREAFIRAEQTFLHQLVYDPVHRKLAPLTPYPPGVQPSAFPFAGSYMDDEVALQLALGNLNVDTLAKMDDFHPDRPKGGATAKLPRPGGLWTGGSKVSSLVQPVELPELPVRPVQPVASPPTTGRQMRTTVAFTLPPVISDEDLTGQYAAMESDDKTEGSLPGSPILGCRKRKRSDENSPEGTPSRKQAGSGNPFAKAKTSPSPIKKSSPVHATSPPTTGGFSALKIFSQVRQKNPDGREVVTSAYFSSEKLSVTDQLKKSVGVNDSHLIRSVQNSQAVQRPFKPVLMPSPSPQAQAVRPASRPTQSAKKIATQASGTLRQLSLRDMFKS